MISWAVELAIVAHARTLLHQSSLPRLLWAEEAAAWQRAWCYCVHCMQLADESTTADDDSAFTLAGAACREAARSNVAVPGVLEASSRTTAQRQQAASIHCAWGKEAP